MTPVVKINHKPHKYCTCGHSIIRLLLFGYDRVADLDLSSINRVTVGVIQFKALT